ncbi:MAG: hypothetical protein ABSD44_00765 [Terracidiphilus sp.]
MADSYLDFAKRETDRLNAEIELLQGRIRLHIETKDAWDTIVGNARSELRAACLDLANSETERLNVEIEAVQEGIRRHIETRDAWDTIVRNTRSEPRIYQGATYVRGEDGQWHLQRILASESNEPEPVPVPEVDRRPASNPVSKVNSVRQVIMNACERTLRAPRKRADLPRRGKKKQLQSLELN